MRVGAGLLAITALTSPQANACVMPPQAEDVILIPPNLAPAEQASWLAELELRTAEAQRARQESTLLAALAQQAKMWDEADRVLIGQFEQWTTITRKHPRRDRIYEAPAVSLSAVKWLKGSGQDMTFAVPSGEPGPCGEKPWSADWRGQRELVILFLPGAGGSDNDSPMVLRIGEVVEPRLLAALTAQ